MTDAPAGAAPAAGTEAAAPAAAFHPVQTLIWPEAGVCTERELYFRLGEGAAFDDGTDVVHLGRGTASFDTYFNLFNIGQWTRRCALRDLHLSLTGTGTVELTVMLAGPGRSWERPINRIVTLSDAPLRIDLAEALEEAPRGVVFFELRGLDAAPGAAAPTLTGAAWETRQPPLRRPELALAITTFRREAAVHRSVARFERYMEASPVARHLHAIVVDNGRSADIPAGPHVTPVGNENLGGAGGFARGLIEAKARGATHCLFMDDDASIHMDSLTRTWTFLAYATDPATAVAGAMINARHKWALWENGAIYDRRCLPQHIGTDLRDQTQMVELQYEIARPAPRNFYGGWWFFAFPLDGVRHLPFPFFVRGDDVSFSLVHGFDIVTLNGVVSFQDGFTGKESPLTWYLDLRSHLVHHLSLPDQEIGAAGLAKIAAWFYARNLIRLHYETLAAINLAVEDVMRGPDWFAANADLAQRRADLGALRRTEAWTDAPPPPGDRSRLNPNSWPVRMLMKATANGHLLPGFRRFGNRITLTAEDRGRVRDVWGAARITIVNEETGQSYTVTHSKSAAWREGWRLLGNLRRLRQAYPRLLQDWRRGYDALTSEPFWHQALKIAPEGRGEDLPEGRGEDLPEGRGEDLPEGRGKIPPEGRDESAPQGRQTAPTRP